MSEPDKAAAEEPQAAPSVSTAPAAEHSRWHVGRIPAHLGRARTSTVVLSALFLAIYALYVTVKPPDPNRPAPDVGTGTVQRSVPSSDPTTPPTSTTTQETEPGTETGTQPGDPTTTEPGPTRTPTAPPTSSGSIPPGEDPGTTPTGGVGTPSPTATPTAPSGRVGSPPASTPSG